MLWPDLVAGFDKIAELCATPLLSNLHPLTRIPHLRPSLGPDSRHICSRLRLHPRSCHTRWDLRSKTAHAIGLQQNTLRVQKQPNRWLTSRKNKYYGHSKGFLGRPACCSSHWFWSKSQISKRKSILCRRLACICSGIGFWRVICDLSCGRKIRGPAILFHGLQMVFNCGADSLIGWRALSKSGSSIS